MNYRKLIETIFSLYSDSQKSRLIQLIPVLNKDYYRYIPVSTYEICEIIKDVRLKNIPIQNRKFIDIGCGVPVIPTIFNLLGANAAGLEYDILYQRIYQELIKGDLLTYNFSDYDILYSYNPISNTELMKEGLKNIVNTMKKGASFYFVLASNNLKILNELGFKELKKGSRIFYYKKK